MEVQVFGVSRDGVVVVGCLADFSDGLGVLVKFCRKNPNAASFASFGR